MNVKAISAVVALVGIITMSQPAEAKHKNWNNGFNSIAAGGCYGPGGVNNRGQHNGWDNGNAFWKNNGNFRNNRWANNNNWGNNNWGNNRWGNNWGNNNYRFRNIDQTQARLSDRIQRGITSGRLTAREADKLRDMESRINSMETRYRNDGRLNFQERNRLSDQLNRLSDRLRRELYDRQVL